MELTSPMHPYSCTGCNSGPDPNQYCVKCWPFTPKSWYCIGCSKQLTPANPGTSEGKPAETYVVKSNGSAAFAFGDKMGVYHITNQRHKSFPVYEKLAVLGS